MEIDMFLNDMKKKLSKKPYILFWLKKGSNIKDVNKKQIFWILFWGTPKVKLN